MIAYQLVKDLHASIAVIRRVQLGTQRRQCRPHHPRKAGVLMIRRTFLRIAWRLNVTPSELLDMRVVDVLARLRR